MATSKSSMTKFSNNETAYVVLPFLTIIIRKIEREIVFKMGGRNRGVDYAWFVECVVFLYQELQCGKKEKNGN